MPAFAGYVAYELIEDLDDPGHLIVLGQWETRRHADDALRDYADHPNARRVNELVSRPRTRFLGHSPPRRR